MKKVLAAAFALLFLLSACQTRPIDAPAETIDPNEDIRTRDARLDALFAETDGPVVVQYMDASVYWHPDLVAKLWNAPHVINVICTSLIHWLDISEEGSLSMIGQYLPDLDPAAIVEGRWYETDTECCLNRAEYERLLADPDAHFTGIGDSVVYAEQITKLGSGLYEKEITPISRTFTVVGIVGDEGKYADPVYGIHHLYALTDAVEAMLVNYETFRVGYEPRCDYDAYAISQKILAIRNGRYVYKPDPEDPGKMLIRCAYDTVYKEDDFRDLFFDVPCNAGYTIEVTLDSGKNYADYVEYYRSKYFEEQTVEEWEEKRQKDNETKARLLGENLTPMLNAESRDKLINQLAPTEMDPTTVQIYMLNEQKEWRTTNGTPYLIHPLRVGE